MQWKPTPHRISLIVQENNSLVIKVPEHVGGKVATAPIFLKRRVTGLLLQINIPNCMCVTLSDQLCNSHKQFGVKVNHPNTTPQGIPQT